MKTYLYTYCTGGFYQFKIYKIEDAAHQVYYVGERTNHGRTVIADTEAELKKKLDAQVPVINDFLSKVDKRRSR